MERWSGAVGGRTEGTVHGRRSRALELGLLGGVLCGGLASGGTTGRTTGGETAEGDSGAEGGDAPADPGPDATVPPLRDPGVDGTLAPDVDEGLFDVVIPYLDRFLPEAQPPMDGGGGRQDAASTGIPWPPNCAADVPSDIAAGAPAQYESDGNVVPAPDGSACATFAWLGSSDWTECVRASTSPPTISDPGAYTATGLLPPCALFVEAGVATRGTMAGQPIYDACKALADCILRTGCGNRPVSGAGVVYCLCAPYIRAEDCATIDPSTDDASTCRSEELAAMQLDPHAQGVMATAVSNLYNFNGSYLAAANVNQLWNSGYVNGCFPLDGAAN